MKKRGQFYITAAIIIVLSLFSIASIATFSIVKQEPKTIDEFSETVNLESAKVIDYGTFNEQDINQLINEEFTTDLKEIIPQGSSVNLIYGNADGLEMTTIYQVDSGTISTTGTGTGITTTSPVSITQNIDVEIDDEGLTNVNINNRNFKFNLGKNEKFYFVIIKDEDGESYVKTNSD